MSFVGNHWATGGIRVNSSSVKGGLISFPLFLLKENAILPMTSKAGCEGVLLKHIKTLAIVQIQFNDF